MRDPENNKRWVVDEEAAELVKRIYKMRLNGESINSIAKTLRLERIDVPSVYGLKKGQDRPGKRTRQQEYLWVDSMVSKMLQNQQYVGDVVNFKTYTKSYKLKKRYENDPENWEIHRDVHEPIIQRVEWEQVQKTFQSKCRKPKHTEKNMFAGYLKCSDCGSNMFYKYLTKSPENHYFSCGRYRVKLCGKTHHIRVDVLEKLVLAEIDNAVRFARDFEDDFVKIVVSEQYKHIQLSQKQNQKKLAKMQIREQELECLFAKVFEDMALGKMPESVSRKMLDKYQEELDILEEQIRHMVSIVNDEKDCEMNVDGFLNIVHRYTRINQLTPAILREFINHIVVHHREKNDGVMEQQVNIHFNFIGEVALPDVEDKAKLLNSFGKEKREQIA